MLVDAAQGARHGQIEARQVGKARQRGDVHPRVVGLRQLMGLLVEQHLHAMLPIAQADIGLLQFLGDGGRQVAGAAQGVKRFQGTA